VNRERDRDRLLEDALTHELRAAAMPPASDACLDAETVAAWMDGGLDAHGMTMAETHAATCARCQSLLGSIARTTPVVAAAEPHGARLWRWWFAPLAATAAAVTVWMVVPQDQYIAPPTPAAVESAAPAASVAKSEEPAAFAQATPPTIPDTKERANVARDRADAPPRRAVAAAPKQEAQSFEAREPRPAEAAKVADAAAEGRVAAMAPPPAAPAPAPPAAAAQAAPVIALRKQVDPVADATARSNPSPNVIWLVGRGGVVHLATDGQTFARVPFPEAVDLTAVTATDERRAVVTTVDGRRFETEDAGRTWRRLQEISASPF
jgi:hypothetical protein